MLARGSEIVREPDYLKFLAEAEKEAVDPDQYLDMSDEDCALVLMSTCIQSVENSSVTGQRKASKH